MMVGCSAHTVPLPASLSVGFLQVLRVVTVTASIPHEGVGGHKGVRRQIPAQPGWRLRADHLVALTGQRAIGFRQVMSARVKARLSGRQPSKRGGGAWVMTRSRS